MADRHEVDGSGGMREAGGRTEEMGADPHPGSESGCRSMQRALPLNSKRLTALLLRQLAGGLGVPTAASPADLCSMIEGKLTEDGRDPLSTQVVLHSVKHGTHLLQDETGVFREFEPPEQEDSSHLDSTPEERSGAEELEETELVVALRAEVAQLKSELESQKVKMWDMWRQNCEQIAEMDGALSEKDEEISSLREELG